VVPAQPPGRPQATPTRGQLVVLFEDRGDLGDVALEVATVTGRLGKKRVDWNPA
jgi:hypothetical protein